MEFTASIFSIVMYLTAGLAFSFAASGRVAEEKFDIVYHVIHIIFWPVLLIIYAVSYAVGGLTRFL